MFWQNTAILKLLPLLLHTVLLCLLALLVGPLNLLQRLLFRTISNLHPVFLHSRANNKNKEQEQEQHGLRKEERVRENTSHVE